MTSSWHLHIYVYIIMISSSRNIPCWGALPTLAEWRPSLALQEIICICFCICFCTASEILYCKWVLVFLFMFALQEIHECWWGLWWVEGTLRKLKTSDSVSWESCLAADRMWITQQHESKVQISWDEHWATNCFKYGSDFEPTELGWSMIDWDSHIWQFPHSEHKEPSTSDVSWELLLSWQHLAVFQCQPCQAGSHHHKQ